MKTWRPWVAAACLWAMAGWASVPPHLALMVMLKVITYDSRFDPELNTDFVVCVPWAPSQKAALEQTLKAFDSGGSPKLGMRHVRIKPVPAADIAGALDAEHAAAVLLLPDTPPALADEMAKEVATRKLYSLTLDPANVATQSMLGVAEGAASRASCSTRSSPRRPGPSSARTC